MRVNRIHVQQMISIVRSQWPQIAMAIMLYATVLMYQGYHYGIGDQSQILPCLFAHDHPDTYPLDHYVKSYQESDLNERTVFHFLFQYLGYNSPWIVWLWHAVLSVFLLLAWLRIAAFGIQEKAYQYLAVAMIFILGYHTSVGSNELYYNMVIPSLAAKALGSWAIYFWLKEEHKWWIGLLVAAGFLQPLVGLQLFILTFLASLLSAWVTKRHKELPWKKIGWYALITLPWLGLLIRNNGGHTSPELFMDIMEFRLSHHFFPGYFSRFDIAVFIGLALVAIRFYKQRLKWFMVMVAVGCIVYTIGVEAYRLPFALYTQWWKTTIWLEAFALIALFVHLEKVIHLPKLLIKFWYAIPIILLLLVGGYRLSGWFGGKPTYMLPWVSERDDAVKISQAAAEVTPIDAVFIVPVDFSSFRWYAKRNLYVDYKAMLHQEDFLKEWYQRIENIYAYGLKEKRNEFDLNIFSTTLLEEPSLISLDYWKSIGITHFISTSPNIPKLERIATNDTYSIYKLE